MTYKKKLIEVALPLVAISEASARESSIKRGKPTQLHKWWAGRPLVSARAILWASLVDDPSSLPDQFPTEEAQNIERSRLFSILRDLVQWENSNNVEVIDRARAEIVRSCDGKLPNIVDPFGGGGALPLEAMRLGLPTFTGDLNPVAVLIQRAMLEIPHLFSGFGPVHPDQALRVDTWTGASGLARDLKHYGSLLRESAQSKVGHLYPDSSLPAGGSATPMAWIWARTVESPDPSWPGHVPLVRSWILSKKAGRDVVWVDAVVDHELQSIEYVVRHGGTPPDGTISRGNGVCIATGTPIPNSYVIEQATSGRMRQRCMAIACEGKRGRTYLSPDTASTDAGNMARPDSPIAGELFPHKKQISVPLYGLCEWEDLFTSRQLSTLNAFVRSLPDVAKAVRSDAIASGLPETGVRLHDGGTGAEAYADAIVTYLAFAIDRLADWNNSLCPWEKNAEVSQQLFGRQAIPMVWDFAEANPFSSSTGSMRATLKTLQTALEVLPDTTLATIDIQQRDARARLREVPQNILSTDPPYYGQIPYADLADFFFAWLRVTLADVWPVECATLATPKSEEIVANQYRAGSIAAAKEHFESGIRETLVAATANADQRFPVTIFYAFRATESTELGDAGSGWETFLKGLLDAGWSVIATWPIRTENRTRRVALGTNALASSVVLACRIRDSSAAMATRGEFLAVLREEMPPAVRLLQAESIAPVDLAQSAMGPGIAVFSGYAKVVEADGSSMTVRAALGVINDVLSEVLSGEESEFDADTRFALTWYEQFGHNPGPYGDASTLARAKNTSVEGVEEAGVLTSREGRVRLVERSELSAGWDPVSDSRLTVWETTQHLIRALDSSESDAAALLTRLGEGMGERAQQLAYLLYGISDQKKWPEEAGAYNMLVTAWPEISRLAASRPAATQSEGSLF